MPVTIEAVKAVPRVRSSSPFRKSSARIPKPLCSRDQRERGAGSRHCIRCYRRVMSGLCARHRDSAGERRCVTWDTGSSTPGSVQRPLLHASRHKVTVGSPGTGIGRCLGTFGELLQGALPIERQEFLVTLPITKVRPQSSRRCTGLRCARFPLRTKRSHGDWRRS